MGPYRIVTPEREVTTPRELLALVQEHRVIWQRDPKNPNQCTIFSHNEEQKSYQFTMGVSSLSNLMEKMNARTGLEVKLHTFPQNPDHDMMEQVLRLFGSSQGEKDALYLLEGDVRRQESQNITLSREPLILREERTMYSLKNTDYYVANFTNPMIRDTIDTIGEVTLRVSRVLPQPSSFDAQYVHNLLLVDIEESSLFQQRFYDAVCALDAYKPILNRQWRPYH